ncbi:unnamed protein product [Moneuplotes crassus]|uniref:RING-type domain-containing protein n=2 Tax=Euplotes crassus TaxID=5936 RepID=A0AAD1U8W5_EUPCR|nr:unnamed protein product [Moneuplotes crassus]
METQIVDPENREETHEQNRENWPSQYDDRIEEPPQDELEEGPRDINESQVQHTQMDIMETEDRAAEGLPADFNPDNFSNEDEATEQAEVPIPHFRFDFQRILIDPSPLYRARFKNISANMRRLIEIYSLLLIFLSALCVQCLITKMWKFQYPLFILIFYYCYCVFRNVQFYRSSEDPNSNFSQTLELQYDQQGNPFALEILSLRRKRMVIRCIIEELLLIFTCVLLLMHTSEIPRIPFYIICFPLLATITMRLLCQACPRSPCETVMHLCNVFMSSTRFLIAIFVLMKEDDIIKWQWSGILWAYWVSFAILCILALFAIIIFLNAIFTYFQDEVDYPAIIGAFWILFFIAGLPGSTCVVVMGLNKIYDNKSISNTSFNIFLHLFMPPLLYLLLSILLTLVFWKHLISWWDYFIYGQDPNIANQENEANNVDQERPVEIRSYDITGLLFLTRISDTLFKRTRRKSAIDQVPTKTESINQRRFAYSARKSAKNRINPKFQRTNKDKTLLCSKDKSKRLQRVVSKAASVGESKDFMNLVKNSKVKKMSTQINKREITDLEEAKDEKDLKTSEDLSKLSSSRKEFYRKLKMDEIMKRMKNRNKEILDNTFGYKEDSSQEAKSPSPPRYLKSLQNDRKNSETSFSNLRQNFISIYDSAYRSEEEKASEPYLSKQNSKIDNTSFDKKCLICYEKTPDSVIMECGHGGICYDCCCQMLMGSANDNKCHFCREEILCIFKLDTNVNDNKFRVISVAVTDEADLHKCLLLIESDPKTPKLGSASSKSQKEQLDSSHRSIAKSQTSGSQFKMSPEMRKIPENPAFRARARMVSSADDNAEGTDDGKIITRNISDRGLFLSSQRVDHTESYRGEDNRSESVRRFTISQRGQTLDPNDCGKEGIEGYQKSKRFPESEYTLDNRFGMKAQTFVEHPENDPELIKKSQFVPTEERREKDDSYVHCHTLKIPKGQLDEEESMHLSE